MKYQEDLMQFIDSTSLRNLPHFLLLIGESGCGKHTLCRYMSERYHMPLTDISEKLSLELLQEITDKSEPGFYLLDGQYIDYRKQNVLLKTLEEPSPAAYFLYLSDAEGLVLPTVKGRSYPLYFKAYTKESLMEFVDSDSQILQYASTPGQILKWQHENLSEIEILAEKMIKYTAQANLSNLLSISNRIAFKEDLDKINLDLLLKVLTNKLVNAIIESESKSLEVLYNRVRAARECLSKGNRDKKMLFEHFLCLAKEEL